MESERRQRIFSAVIGLALVVLIIVALSLAWQQFGQRRPVAPAGYLPVLKVADGDTIEVGMDGRREKVRLVGVNTPESVDPRRPVQCFGREAAAFAKRLLPKGSVVRLQPDSSTVKDRDKYGRLLRYVYLSDGSMLNRRLLEEGYAQEYTYQSERYDQQAAFKEAAAAAQAAGKGLWSPQTCAGDVRRPA